MHQSTKGFRTKTAMNHPLLTPCSLESCGSHSRKPVSYFGLAERDEAILHFRSAVWVVQAPERITVKNRSRAGVEKNERSVQIGLIREVVMHPFCEITAITDITGRRIVRCFPPWRYTGLNLRPFTNRRHEICVRQGRPVTLVEFAGAIGNGFQQELRDVGT